jgi:hypothetical protein
VSQQTLFASRFATIQKLAESILIFTSMTVGHLLFIHWIKLHEKARRLLKNLLVTPIKFGPEKSIDDFGVT